MHKSLVNQSGEVAARWENICSYRNIAVDDAGRSNRKNRNARRPCHRQREQENRLRPRRRRTRKHIRQGERTRRANYRRTRVSQDAVTQLTALSGCAAEKNLRSKFRAWVARRNRARAGSPADLLRACRERQATLRSGWRDEELPAH